MYTFSLVGHFENAYKFSGYLFIYPIGTYFRLNQVLLLFLLEYQAITLPWSKSPS